MAKRGENIYKRKDGRWEGRYIIGRKPSGQARYASVYGKSYRDVKELLDQKKGERFRSLPSCGLTMRVLLENWLSLRATEVKASSFQRYETLIEKHILTRLGGIRVNCLTTEVLVSFIKDLQENGRLDGGGGLSDKTISDIMCILRSAIRLAARKYAIRDETLFDVKAPTARQKRVETLGELECEALTRYVLEEPDLFGAAYLLALGFGLRLGEICGLKWSDINFQEKELAVKRTVLRVKCGRYTQLTVQTPKTETSARVIPLTAEILKLLSEVRNTHSDETYILTGSKIRPQDPRTLQYRFHRFLQLHGLRDHNFHTLRHTFATRSIEKGFDAKTLSEILGHKNVKTTLQLYVHPTMTNKRKIVEAISPLPVAG